MRYRIKLQCPTCLGETYKKVTADAMPGENDPVTPAEQQAMDDELAQHTAGHGPLTLLRRDPL